MTKNKNNGFTIVELLVVIVVIGIMSAFVVSSFGKAQVKARNVAMVDGAKKYQKIVELYKAEYGDYPKHPAGTTTANTFACFGDSFLTLPCVVENVEATNIYSQSWFSNALKQYTGNLPNLPVYVTWNEGTDQLKGGAFYQYQPSNNAWLGGVGLTRADAMMVYYLEGDERNTCTRQGFRNIYAPADGSYRLKTITVCVLPLGSYN